MVYSHNNSLYYQYLNRNLVSRVKRNQEDSVIINRSAIERGLFVSTSYRTLVDEEKKQGTYNYETICMPPVDKRKRNCNYSYLNESGIVQQRINGKATFVNKGDVIIGKTLTKSNKNGEEEIYDCSFIIKSGEEGYIDKVIETVTPNGYKMIKVTIRNQKIPEIGDKFASRAAQKGTLGMVYSQEEMPFTQDGIVPDLILNPQAIPSRMTINILLEMLLGKSCVLEGKFGDATPFTKNSVNIAETLCDRLEKNGFNRFGWETMYSGFTGEPITAKIYTAPSYYCRLKHMVSDKVHCLDMNTEVLTLDGWKTAHQLTKNDLIATLKDEKLVYENPIDILIYPDYEGSMYYIKNQDIDLAVTGNHRMWVSRVCVNKGTWLPYDFARADEIVGKHLKYKKDALWEKEYYQFIFKSCENNNIVDMNSWLMFFGICYAQGWSIGSETSGKIYIDINKKIVKDLSTALNKLGYEFTIDDSDKLEICDYQLYLYMKQLSVKDDNKKLPSWVFELSKNQIQILIRSMLVGDEFYTRSHILADQIQQLCLHAGWAGIISTEAVDDVLRISVITQRLNPTVNNGDVIDEKLIEKEKCPVFCLQVPSEVFYIRRNGKTCWTANSRASGHVTTLTRQPLEGRSRDGQGEPVAVVNLNFYFNIYLKTKTVIYKCIKKIVLY
jgi:hypothetical protein